jgi:polyphosphate kinase
MMKPQIDTSGLPELTPDHYINREVAWIEFNRRVLDVAKDATLPLLERLKFLAIFSSNMDEFFMVRVGYLHSKIKLHMGTNRPDGLLPSQALELVHEHALALMQEQRALIREVLNLLEGRGVYACQVAQLPPNQREAIRQYFSEEVYPVLTPLAVDRARPFPFISNLSLNLAIWLRRPVNGLGEKEFVRLKVPDVLPRLINVDEVMQRYGDNERVPDTLVWLEDVISDNLAQLFPGMEVVEHWPFRVTRNAEFDYESEQDDDESLDMSQLVEESIRERSFGPVVRLSVPQGTSQRTLNELVRQLPINPNRDVYEVDGALGAASLFGVYALERPDLKDPTHIPHHHETLESVETIFEAIRQGDVLVHHPYDSFAPVETFFQAAARDVNVLAIKATLYRVGRNSPVVQALMDARDNGKQVTVLVELKARFDEENNLEWARAMDEKGVHVIYGVEELPIKTHAKVALIVRREPDGVRRYVHLGTGNYNASTARTYTDLGLFTCDPEIAEDASRLFNRLTGYAPDTSYTRLLVAPDYLLPTLVDLIDNEIAAARAGKDARLIFKMNQLEEDIIVRKLYQAAQAGVQVDLLVRGLCCLVPGLPGVSENIQVRSIVGRFLEHSRIFYFQNAPPDQRVYLGSADLMRRNLYNRVEVVFPVLHEQLQAQVVSLLQTQLQDNQQTWIMRPDGLYERVQPDSGEPAFNSQEICIENSFGNRST